MKEKKIKIVAVIPARLESLRFTKKIIYPLLDLPMIEHVRRRVSLCKDISEVYVVTNNKKIGKIIENFGGKVLYSKERHLNGTSRVSEVIDRIDCSHVLIVQGDEPLILPRHIDQIINQIKKENKENIWCTTSDLSNKYELDRQSVVKCSIEGSKILFFFRRSLSHLNFNIQNKYIKKVQGLIVFEKKTLLKYKKFKYSKIEKKEKIEQISYLTNGFNINLINLKPCLPSINYLSDVKEFYQFVKQSPEQKKILKKIYE